MLTHALDGLEHLDEVHVLVGSRLRATTDPVCGRAPMAA
jgi:hypothetical protein